MGQIPYVRYANEEPRTCHMTLQPCPTVAQYMCIYSAEKMNSYCCAPIDTAFIGQSEISVQQHRQRIPIGIFSLPFKIFERSIYYHLCYFKHWNVSFLVKEMKKKIASEFF